MNDELVWYVCYGSNLCYERFMCYITGKPSAKYNVGASAPCKNANPPLKSRVVEIPYRLYFAKNSSRWQNMGVCFIDPLVSSKTIGRAYLITLEQFNTILEKEGLWYRNQIDLGMIDGIRALTFTPPYKYEPETIPSSSY